VPRDFLWKALIGDVVYKADKYIGSRDVKIEKHGNGLLRHMTVGPPDNPIPVKETIVWDEEKGIVKYDALDDPHKTGYVHTSIKEWNGHLFVTGEFVWNFNSGAPLEIIKVARDTFPTLTQNVMANIVKFTEEEYQKVAGPMKNYVVERELPGAGSMPCDALKAVCNKSCSVLCEMGPQVQWVQSYVVADKIFCIYRARNEEDIKKHASKGGFPCNKISEVKTIIDPTKA
jgi:hypothetical protein